MPRVRGTPESVYTPELNVRGSSRIIRILLVLAVGLAWTLSLTPKNAAAETKVATSATQVYQQTGVWAFNGRTWKTNCSTYSSTERCRTEIWGTLVTYKNGKFSQGNAWVFNNLTYKTSPRSVWAADDPLVTPGEHTVNGRKWKTECNTSWTGQGACRSQIWATVAGLKDGKYQNINQWVFNNIVNLTPLKCPVTEKQLADAIKEPVAYTSCLQSKVDKTWVATQYEMQDPDGAWYTATAFFKQKSAGWGLEAYGGMNASNICDYWEDAVPPQDLADTISYCFSG